MILFLAGALFFVTRKLYHGNGQAWVGVTEAKAYTISSEKQATVKSIHVVQGQAIKKGDTLIQLMSVNLLQEIDRLQNKISTFQSEKEEKKKLTQSDIELVRSSQDIEINQLKKEITLAESEIRLNKSIAGNTSTEGQESPLQEKIKSLKEEIKLRERATQIKINDIQVRNNAEQTILKDQIQLLQNELDLLEKEKGGLIKISHADGVVESVPIKNGDEVDAYTRLISVLPTRPTSVVGYLQSEKSNPAIGTAVEITGYNARWKKKSGKIIGYGAVTPLPDILQRSTAVKAFGKEIFIELPPENEFSTGEKLLIRLMEE